MLLITNLSAGFTMRPNKPKYWSLEQGKVYCKNPARTMGAHAQKTRTPCFQERVLKGNIWGGGCKDVTFF